MWGRVLPPWSSEVTWPSLRAVCWPRCFRPKGAPPFAVDLPSGYSVRPLACDISPWPSRLVRLHRLHSPCGVSRGFPGPRPANHVLARRRVGIMSYCLAPPDRLYGAPARVWCSNSLLHTTNALGALGGFPISPHVWVPGHPTTEHALNGRSLQSAYLHHWKLCSFGSRACFQGRRSGWCDPCNDLNKAFHEDLVASVRLVRYPFHTRCRWQ